MSDAYKSGPGAYTWRPSEADTSGLSFMDRLNSLNNVGPWDASQNSGNGVDPLSAMAYGGAGTAQTGVPQTQDWRALATKLMGAQAPAVIQGLSQVDPNRDWSPQIQQTAAQLGDPSSGWQDPARGSSASIVAQMVINSQDPKYQPQISTLQQAAKTQEQQQLAAQNPKDDGLFGDLGPLLAIGGLALGGAGLAGYGPLSGLFGGAAGAGEAASAMYGAGGEFAGLGAGGEALASGVAGGGLTGLEGLGVGTSGAGGISGAGGLSSIVNGLGGAAGALGKYQFPWGQAISAAVGAYGANQSAKTLAEAMDRATEKADPFASQRGRYQQQLPGALSDLQRGTNSQNAGYRDLAGRLDTGYNDLASGYRTGYNDLAGSLRSQYDTEAAGYNKGFGDLQRQQQAGFDTLRGDYQNQINNATGRQQSGFDSLFAQQQAQNARMQDPNYWNNDSLLAGLNELSVNDTSRAMAAQGYNMSGNIPLEVAQRLQKNNATYVPGFMNAITQNQNTALGGYNTNANTQLGALNQAAQTGLGAYNQNAGNQLSGYNQNTSTQLGNRAQMSNSLLGNYNTQANSQLGNYNQNAGQQISGYNTNANNNLQSLYNNANLTGTYAGGGTGPGSAGTIAGQAATANAGLQNQLYGNLGVGFDRVFTGNQPTAAQQIGGVPRNQTLYDMWRS